MSMPSFSDRVHQAPDWVESDGDVLVPDTGKEYTSERWTADHIASADHQAAGALEIIDEPGTLDRPSRLFMLFEAEGFYPASNDEFDRMIAMSSANQTKHRAARHLNEVLRHQQSYAIKQPEKALYRIVSGFESFANSARVDSLSLEGLRTDPHLTEANPLQGFLNIPHMSDLIKDPQVARALVVLTRSSEIRAFAADAKFDPLLKVNALETSPQKNARVLAVLGRVRAGEMARLLETASTQERARLEYWLARIEESQYHSVVKEESRIALAAIRLKLNHR